MRFRCAHSGGLRNRDVACRDQVRSGGAGHVLEGHGMEGLGTSWSGMVW